MKKMFFLSLLLTVLMTSNATACLLRDDDKSRIDFVRDNISGTKGDHHDLGRTLNSENWIEGYLNISRKEVELSLFNIGEVEMGDQRDPYKVLTLTGITIKGIRLGEDER